MVRLRLILLLTILVGLGIILTYFSIFLPPTAMTVTPGATGYSSYGVPLPWKVNNVLYCSPSHPQACPSPVYSTDFDWLAFAADVLLYALAGYLLFVGYSRLSKRTLAG